MISVCCRGHYEGAFDNTLVVFLELDRVERTSAAKTDSKSLNGDASLGSLGGNKYFFLQRVCILLVFPTYVTR